ncbi:hypothetical protein NLI96_g1470 [Meripilus lineatus]|uniref:Uncharacterized protein n=1 Tax=Meripilus lineatus TaxID=2056292 RepID=A0AAD5YKW4_9APHY|nr:hypothetical protein NLI96_g1470 [Physisporinus lineatus]
MLENHNSFGVKIPYILLTNGGGIGEEERCRKLSNLLGVQIKPTQYIQAHTVLKSVVNKYAAEPVLVLGGARDNVRKVAESYGFLKAYTPWDVHAWNPSEFERPRLGQGAFREAFQAVYKALTGATYPYIQYGKPSAATYEFAEQVLKDRVQEIYGEEVEKMPNVYMVGDNPESDIAGANAAGWSSVLVRTGVYDPATGPPKHRPSHEAEDVEAAVKWAIEREMSRRQR